MQTDEQHSNSYLCLGNSFYDYFYSPPTKHELEDLLNTILPNNITDEDIILAYNFIYSQGIYRSFQLYLTEIANENGCSLSEQIEEWATSYSERVTFLKK